MATGPAAPRRRKTLGDGWEEGGTMGTARRREERRGRGGRARAVAGGVNAEGRRSVEQDVRVTAQVVFEVALERVHDVRRGSLV